MAAFCLAQPSPDPPAAHRVCVRVSVCSLYVTCFGSLWGPGEGVMGPVALLQDPFEDEKLVSPIKVPPTHSQKVCR